MNIGEIVKDAIKYPVSDWKKILILGIIIVISQIAGIALSLGTTNIDVISLLIGIGFIIGFLVNGYMFRIIQSSLEGKIGFPEFNDWVNMGLDGAKVFITFIVYLIITVVVILFFLPLFFGSDLTSIGSMLFSMLGSMWPNSLDAFVGLVGPIISLEILNFAAFLFNLFGPISTIYVIIVIPLFLMAIANMAYYEGEFKSAFQFREILGEIRSIGWLNLIKWYAATEILFLILFIMANVISYSSSLIHYTPLEIIVGLLLSLTLIPYAYMYIARSVALFYMPDKED